MLVLTRKLGERIRVGHAIEITVLKIGSGKVKLGFSGPPDIPIQRQELIDEKDSEGEKDARLAAWIDGLLTAVDSPPLCSERPAP